MFLTTISTYKGFDRAIELKEQAFNEDAKSIENKCVLHHYNASGLLIPELDKLIILTNDNKATITTEDGEKGDYDVVIEWSEDSIPSKHIFETLFSYCDQIGKINEKANYRF